jgi:uncharacterized protein YjbI with pentapeptide repeats
MLETLTDFAKKLDNFYSLSEKFWNHFFQGSDFFRKRLSGGSLANCKLQGSDFRRSHLQNIDFSNSKFKGKSYIKILATFCILLFSIYVSFSFKEILQVSWNNNEFQFESSIDYICIYLMSFDPLIMFSLAWSIYNPSFSLTFYGIYIERVKRKNIKIEEETSFWYGSRYLIISLISGYSILFKLVIKAFSLMFFSIDDILSTLDNAISLFALILSLFVNRCFFTSPLLFSTSFEGATLDDVNFTNADLTGVSFKKAILKNVNFTGANLMNVDFTGTIFENVSLEAANVFGEYYKKGDMIYHISTIPGLID